MAKVTRYSQAECSAIVPDSAATTRLQQQQAGLPLQEKAAQLGAHPHQDGAAFGFYLPGSVEAELVVYRSQTPIDPAGRHGKTVCTRCVFPLSVIDDYAWLVLQGVRFGSKSSVGDLYWVRSRRNHTEPMRIIRDPLGHSVPFGASGPAELYDLHWPSRQDADYLKARAAAAPNDERVGVGRLTGPSAILQIHVPTATSEGSFRGLSALFQAVADKIRNGVQLSPFEESLCSYDAVQLMPIEPVIEYEGRRGFWAETYIDDGVVSVEHGRPDMTNWGYDIMTIGSPAVNPTLLATGRPDEFVEFLETMHTFPGKGIQVILDIVYGHADNQSQPLLQPEFIAGPGMYGQVLDYRHPVVREILLEMQRRKSCYGIDGLRVDGAQDFKYYDPEAQQLLHDDDYLHRMNDQVVEVADSRYLPWMIFEDGRPWPDDDWELSSTYLEVTRQLPNVLQWGPLTFAHNTPFLYTFWAQKWWRVREAFLQGESWITGCANHDTLRRGTQVDPEERINSRLGSDHRAIFRRGYNNPGAQLLAYAAMPGVPMDFLHANIGAPWSFIRNTDDRWAIKVVSEESRFLTWAVDDALYARSDSFVRLKGFGFTTLERLRGFLHHLDLAMRAAEYHRETAARILDAALPNSPLSPHSLANLNAFARAWMDDLHEYCNASRWHDGADSRQSRFHRELRELRRQYPYLSRNINPATETVFHLEPCNGSVVYCALRHNPADDSRILVVINMEGKTVTLRIENLLSQAVARLAMPDGSADAGKLSDAGGQLGTAALTGAKQQVLLHTPGAECVQGEWRLPDSEGCAILLQQ
ncbi:glucosylglycerol hydrolase [Spirochaeta africana]|uniref:Glycosidase n=1 Tax=Spirochaeta africana (strain ATCC 700263 / DSM 8902 / Z-7692) TaxID=889378 RepID=H9UIM2_SPIAZ|nr:glucosylglycerol hydrolase [Spirochaeta africana]AFG37365.1 hypothetical protein Spiaf_1290 [Spirochaeta africana DSM 8902]